MGRISGIYLSSGQRKQLRNFARKTKNKLEFRAAQGVLLRSAGKPAEEVARQFDVTIKQVFVWTRKFRTYGAEGLRVKKQTGRPAKKAELAKPRIEKLLDKDPQLFGYLKGRWVLRDISRQLKKENIDVHYSSVHRILGDIGVALKSPKLRAPGSIKKNYRKRAEIKRYKRIAPALLKKRYSSASKMKNGQNFYQKPSVAGLKREQLATSQHSVTRRE